MSPSSAHDERHDYLVRARAPSTLARAQEAIANDPDFILLRQIGPSDKPHTLVVSTTEEAAAGLRQRFASDLIVERDRPLKLF